MSTSGATRATVMIGALGVVYGDIGTSPLYAMRECFVGASGFPVDEANVLGVLSLVTWSLVVVVTLKYLLLVLRADNQGEGGILALAHLIVPADPEQWSRRQWGLVGVGLFGAALLFGDGVITPALSVLSAVEGLRVVTPSIEPFIVPITLVILVALFSVQRFGTAWIGQFFGPVTLLWFGVLGALGAYQIVQHPMVLWGLDPRHAVGFFSSHGLHGLGILGSVFLAVTGAEALYADLGHFGRSPIQQSWFAVVFPGLLLNYFGQGSLLLRHPEVVSDVFYHLAPPWALVPLVVMATLATIIASQAVISGVYSLTRQAVRLDYLPRALIEHTSSTTRGQIFVPGANRFLWMGTLTLVVTFQSSSNLASAYGIAVSLTMIITTGLMYFVMTQRWSWPVALAAAVCGVMIAVDLAFFSSIMRKVASGGWIPLTIAAVIGGVMAVWRRGRQLVKRHKPTIDPRSLPRRRDGPLVVLVRDAVQVPDIEDAPSDVVIVHVERSARPTMVDTPHGTVRSERGWTFVDACFGWRERHDVPAMLASLVDAGQLDIDVRNASYVVIRELLPPADDQGMPAWSKPLYAALDRRAWPLANVLELPPHRVVEVHPVVELKQVP